MSDDGQDEHLGADGRRPAGIAPEQKADDPVAFPTLDSSQIERLHAYGAVEEFPADAVLFDEGSVLCDLLVVLEGEVAVVRRNEGYEQLIVHHGAGRFIGELGILTGQRTTIAARAAVDTTVLRVPVERLRALMAAESDLSDLIFSAFVARRELLRSGPGAGALRLLGSRYSARSLELRSFARRERLAHVWIDLDGPDVGDIDVLMASVGARRSDVPVVVTPNAVLRNPTVAELAAHLGLAFRPVEGRVYDVVVVGAGPAGLAAAVYGASEGLDTLVVDALGPGGQAGTTSRIENFFGFPAGVSGSELVERGALQATRLGARINTSGRVVALSTSSAGFEVALEGGDAISTRTVIVAVGVQYRKLSLDLLARFEGAGVYYAATELEAQMCSPEPVVVIGGGNSAGQAAVYLAQRGSPVTILVRGDGLAASMSQYLIDRIDASPLIGFQCRSEVVELHGDRRLTAVTVRHTGPDGVASDTLVGCAGMFSFIGAVPFTDWLRGCCDLDDRGFVRTDRDVDPGVPLGGTLLPFETSMPGVFAVGDVRHGSMKRVAAAVGEGSSAIRSVHEHLARVLR